MTASHAERIEAALQTPALLTEVEGGFAMAQAGFLDLEIPDDANDLYPIELNADEFRTSPSIVYADTLDALREIALEYSRIKMNGAELHDLDDRLVHQGEHADIIRRLGGKSTFGLQIGMTRDGSQTDAAFIFAPTELKTNKLGLALIAGYPTTPTPEDVEFVKALGYSRGVPELTVYAQQYEMPLPLSEEAR